MAGLPKTKDQIKAEVQEYQLIASDPTLAKIWGIFDIITDFQSKIKFSQPVYEMTMDNIVPVSVKNYLEGSKYKYTVTSVPVAAPPNMPYTTTWVRITKISWA